MSHPTQSQDPLLQPFMLKHLTIRNRIMSTSHADGHTDKGMPKESLQRYHEEKARGGIGLSMFGGSSNVSPDSPNVFGQLDFSQDAVIPYLQNFSKRIHQQGAALMVQITHLGRRGSPMLDHWLPTIAPSRIRETVHRSIPKEMDTYDIQRVVREYGDAALRCKEGGLDGLETMTAAHLTGQFLSPMTNQRTDQYGGSLENRLRFLREVNAEIRRRVGDEFIVGIRYVIDEKSKGWLTADDAIRAAKLLEQDGMLDFFNLVVGRIDTERKLSEECMPGMEQPLAPFLANVADFRRELSLPIFHATRIVDIETARAAIRSGTLDMVAMTRAHIADPHLVNKIMRGEEKRVRPCVGTQFCQANRPSTCIHNPATSREAKLPHIVPVAEQTRNVVIVGGGVAGLEAARVCAERGHTVTLFEAADTLGGQLKLATKVSARQPLAGIVDWRVSELKHLGVKVHLNKHAAIADILAVKPDVVVVATGGTPYIAGFTGATYCNSVWDVLAGTIDCKDETVLVYDGTGLHPAPSCAEYLAEQGATVQFVTIDGRLAEDMGYAERVIHRKRFQQLAIPVVTDLSPLAVTKQADKYSVTFRNELTDTTQTFAVDRVIVEQGTTPTASLYSDLRTQSSNLGVTEINSLLAGTPQPNAGAWPTGFELHRIGDAVSSRSIHSAIYDAFRLCVNL